MSTPFVISGNTVFHEVLSTVTDPASIGHAIVFPTWHSLVRDQGLSDKQAVELMLRLTCDCERSE